MAERATGRCYGGPLHGGIRNDLTMGFDHVTIEDPMPVNLTKAWALEDHRELTITAEYHRYEARPVVVQAQTLGGNDIEKYMFFWVLKDYKLSVHDVSQIVADLMHGVKWQYWEPMYRRQEMTYDQRKAADLEKWYADWHNYTIDRMIREFRIEVVTPLEHGPAIPEGLMELIG